MPSFLKLQSGDYLLLQDGGRLELQTSAPAPTPTPEEPAGSTGEAPLRRRFIVRGRFRAAPPRHRGRATHHHHIEAALTAPAARHRGTARILYQSTATLTAPPPRHRGRADVTRGHLSARGTHRAPAALLRAESYISRGRAELELLTVLLDSD